MVWNPQLSRLSSLFASLVIASTFIPSLAQEVRIGAAAPAFKVMDSNGKAESLELYRGKYVVLEWHNQGCPYTKKHYTSGNMQSLQKEWDGQRRGVADGDLIGSRRAGLCDCEPGE
jgi:AhpC/TSA family